MSVQTVAIVIGISHYQEISDLPAAEMDAVNFARALRNWGISEEHIFLLLNEEASKENLDAFLTMLQAREDYCKFIFYFCGHGLRTQGAMPRSFLMFSDSFLTSDHRLNAYSLDAYFERAAKLNISESYLFIDACDLRINHFVNPKLEEEIKGKRSEKNVFCLFSSGIEKSYESVHGRYGYFTKALLNSLCLIRKSEGSPTQLLHHIQNEMKARELPLPEMVNFGSQKISFIPNDDFFIDMHDTIYRASLISEIQDVLIQRQDKVILLFGEEGCGKTTVCRWLASEKTRVIYLEIPFTREPCFDPKNFLDRKFYETFGCSFDVFDREYPSYLVVIDQLERLHVNELVLFVERLQQSVNVRFLCASRRPLENLVSGHPIFQIPVPALSPREGKLLIQKIRPNDSEREAALRYLISRGNPSKITEKINQNGDVKTVEVEETKKVIAAVYSCGVYYDKGLFMRVFHLQQEIIDFFEDAGLIVPLKDSFVPHQFLNEFAEREGLTSDPEAIFTYWCQQAAYFPGHPEIAKSFILAIKCFGYKKETEKTLKQAIHTLSITEDNLCYFIDGAEVDLSLPYRTSVTVYLANVLRRLGEKGIANQLLKKTRNRKKLVALVSLSLLIIASLSFAFWLQRFSSRLIRDKKAAAILDLRNAQALQKRTMFDQAKLYQKAKKELMIIGISGLRIVDEGKDGGPNPVFNTIINLIKKNVQVKLMIYNKKLIESQVNRNNLFISMEKAFEMQNQYSKYFECRILSIRPPFHGDLIDKNEVHIVPLTIKGMEKMPSDVYTCTIESYEKGEKPENKFNLILGDFQTLWESGERIARKHIRNEFLRKGK